MKPLPVVLGLLAIATAFPAWMSRKVTDLGPADLAGQLLTRDHKEVPAAQIAEFEVITWDDSTGAAKGFAVKKSGGTWVIPSYFSYPADAGTKVGKLTGGVRNVERGRMVTSDTKLYEQLGVVDPKDDAGANKKGRGKRVTLKDATGGVLVDLIVGNPVPDSDGLKFVRQADEKAVYVAKVDADITTRFTDWVETDLLKLKKEDIRKVLIVDYSVDADKGTIESRGETMLEHKSADGDWVSPQAPADKRASKDTADKLTTEVTGLRLVGVRPFRLNWLPQRGFFPQNDPKLLKQDNALIQEFDGHPYALFSNEGRLDVVAKDGLRYSLVFGSVALDDAEDTDADSGKSKSDKDKADKDKKDDKKDKDAAKTGHNRYMAVFVHYDPQADEDAKEEAKREAEKAKDAKPGEEKKADKPKDPAGKARAEKAQARFGRFFYVISDDSFKNMRPAVDKLFEDKPKEPQAGSTGKTNSQWLEENGKKPGITTTASGLQYEVISSGPDGGRKPGASDEVSVTYKGTLIDGKVFDESKNGPTTFRVDGVIKGWTEALQLMKEGDKWRLFIPPAIAYGEKGSPPNIGANEILTFEVQLVKVVTPAAAKPADAVAPAPAPAPPSPAATPAK